MRFKVDENLPVEVANLLRQEGHDAETVYQQRMSGVPDPNIAAVCRAEGRALVTMDLGLGDIRQYPPTDYHGIVVLRLRRQSKRHVLGVLPMVAALLDTEPLSGRLWIVNETGVRIHGRS